MKQDGSSRKKERKKPRLGLRHHNIHLFSRGQKISLSPSTSIWPQITGEIMCQSLQAIGGLCVGVAGRWTSTSSEQEPPPPSLIHQGDHKSACWGVWQSSWKPWRRGSGTVVERGKWRPLRPAETQPSGRKASTSQLSVNVKTFCLRNTTPYAAATTLFVTIKSDDDGH